MMWADDAYKIVIFGHRDFCGHRTLDEQLYPLLKDLIRAKPFVEIYIGRNGEFDIYAASVIKRVQNSIGKENSELICVLPYHEKNMEHYEQYYDTVMIPECIEKTHPKGAITKRNKWMVEQGVPSIKQVLLTANKTKGVRKILPVLLFTRLALQGIVCYTF